MPCPMRAINPWTAQEIAEEALPRARDERGARPRTLLPPVTSRTEQPQATGTSRNGQCTEATPQAASKLPTLAQDTGNERLLGTTRAKAPFASVPRPHISWRLRTSPSSAVVIIKQTGFAATYPPARPTRTAAPAPDTPDRTRPTGASPGLRRPARPRLPGSAARAWRPSSCPSYDASRPPSPTQTKS